MAAAAIHVVPDDNFEDWIVRDDKGHVFGHFATREVAEPVAEEIARAGETDLVIHLPDGTTSRKSFARGWLARLFGK
jgi:hypothetical protein